jgi:hypothetical protein
LLPVHSNAVTPKKRRVSERTVLTQHHIPSLPFRPTIDRGNLLAMGMAWKPGQGKASKQATGKGATRSKGQVRMYL